MIKKTFKNENSQEVKLLSSEIINEGGANLNNLFEYSTNETIVGTWINGKPIYQRVYTMNNITSSVDLGASIDVVVDMQMIIENSNTAGYPQWRVLPWIYGSGSTTVDASWIGGYYITENDGKLRFQVNENLGVVSYAHFIIKYTKNS